MGFLLCYAWRQIRRWRCVNAAHWVNVQIKCRSWEYKSGHWQRWCSWSQPMLKSCAVFECEILVFRGFILKRGIRVLCSVIRKENINAYVRQVHSHPYFSFVHEKDQWEEMLGANITDDKLFQISFSQSIGSSQVRPSIYPNVSGTNKISTRFLNPWFFPSLRHIERLII